MSTSGHVHLSTRNRDAPGSYPQPPLVGVVNTTSTPQPRPVLAPSTAHCPSCSAPTLAALEDFDPARGGPRIVDPYPLTIAAEIYAVVAGITTYNYWKGECIMRRTHWNFTKRGTANAILAEHRCGISHEIDPGDMARLYPARPSSASDAPPF